MISVEDLQDSSQFQMLKVLDHEQLVPFVQQQIRAKNWLTFSFWLINILCLLLLILSIFDQIWNKNIAFTHVLAYVGGGFCAFFVLIPLHELIHGFAYKLVGAPKISYGAQIRKMIFYALADRFVLGKKAFFVVALAPFVLISSFVIVFCYFNYENIWLCSGISLLLMHSNGCVGDFALMSFFHENRKKEVYTYDDLAEKKTYFCVKK
ncbi:MAG: DUF3267 domain-containing protein [Bacteroidetes bacterium]|nr:MAG: DUF3267 domain-containing protein [Bacteroidota bacterium]